jgi:hypothetical protein
MLSPALIKFVVEKWNDDEDEIALGLQSIAGKLHGTTVVDQDTELPFACTFAEMVSPEIHTANNYLETYNLKLLFYGAQNSLDHHNVGKLINNLLLERCKNYYIDNDVRILHILPGNNKFEVVEKELLAGRDLLVSEFNYTILCQHNLVS